MADYWKYHNNPNFQNKSRGVLVKVAIDVMEEASGTTNHTERVAFAKKILSGEVNLKPIYLGLFTYIPLRTIITNMTGGDGDYLSELIEAVESVYNKFAGVAT